MPVTHPVFEISEQLAWSDSLRAIGRQPLAECPEFPRIAQRFDAWWRQEVIDRPLWIATANNNPASPITRRIDLIEKPDEWLNAKLRDLHQTAWFGDAIPHIRVDFGAACLGALLGAPIEFSSDTTWTHACIKSDDWSDAPSFKLDTEGKWWKLFQHLLDNAAEAAKGQFLVCTPSPGGLADVLTNLRGATEICMDLLEQPDRIVNAMNEMHLAWHQAFCELYHRPLAKGAGLFHWHLVWSDVPYVVNECDLAFSIGPTEFRDICLPDIERTAQSVGRSIFHLDGVGSTRHLDALLEIPEIRAIQYTPGAGSPSAMAWLDMFHRVQDAGRSVLIFAPAREVVPLFESLRPEGLAVLVDGPASVQELQQIQHQISSRFGEQNV